MVYRDGQAQVYRPRLKRISTSSRLCILQAKQNYNMLVQNMILGISVGSLGQCLGCCDIVENTSVYNISATVSWLDKLKAPVLQLRI
jgi:hypothetical protein